MIRMKLFNYELKQIILSKKYFYINLVLVLFGLRTLYSNLSPCNVVSMISKWSYANFIAQNNSFFVAFTALLCISVFSNNENKVKNIMFATPFSEKGYYATKQLSIFIAMCISLLILIATSFIWYGYYFRFYSFHQFLYPIIIFAFPAMIFILGAAMNIGRWSEKVLYLLVPILFIGTMLNLELPPWIDIAGNNTLYLLSFTIDKGNPNFILPLDFIYSRVLMVVVGILLGIFACRKNIE